jgi:hypothetical protein
MLGCSCQLWLVKSSAAGNGFSPSQQPWLSVRSSAASSWLSFPRSFFTARNSIGSISLPLVNASVRWCRCGGCFRKKIPRCFSASASWAVLKGVSLRSVVVYAKIGVSFAGSIHLPCSRIKSCNRSTASASGILNFTAVLPT